MVLQGLSLLQASPLRPQSPPVRGHVCLQQLLEGVVVRHQQVALAVLQAPGACTAAAAGWSGEHQTPWQHCTVHSTSTRPALSMEEQLQSSCCLLPRQMPWCCNSSLEEVAIRHMPQPQRGSRREAAHMLTSASGGPV